MLERVQFFLFHGAVHFFGYLIPRWLHILLVRLPVTLWELITMKRPITYSFRRERQIKVVTTSADTAASAHIKRFFGLTEEMHYTDPLYNGHVQTLLGAARLPKRVPYERELVPANDGNPICLDWLKVPADGKVKAKAVLLIIPGLGNYGQTNYIQRLVRAAAARGYHCCVLTPRGMGSAPLTTPNITCVTFSADINHVLRNRLTKKQLAEQFGVSLPLVAIGYSCGATTLLKSLSEEATAFEKEGKACYADGFPVDVAISMLAPTDMAASAGMLRTKWGTRLYAKPIMTALRKYLRKHKQMLMTMSEGKSEEEKKALPLIHVDFEAAMKCIKDPRDVDVYVVAAHFGYEDEKAYYKHGHAFNYISKINACPLLVVSNHNDPISGYVVTPDMWQKELDRRPNVAYVEMPAGGHFGYLQTPIKEQLCPFSLLQSFPLDHADAAIACELAESHKEL